MRDTDKLLHHTGAGWASFPVASVVRVAATDRVLGRVSAGAGAAEEIAFTDQAQALCDDTSFSAMRTTLGLGGADEPLFRALWVGPSGYLILVRNVSGTNRIDSYDNPITGATPMMLNASQLTIAISDTHKVVIENGALRPASDNAVTVGAGSFRWSTVFAATGTINTSDAREKTPLQPIPDSVKRAVRRVIAQVGVFQWLEAVERKGEAGARKHVGVTAQAVRDAFIAEGEDPARWALFCEDPVLERVEIEPARTESTVIVDPDTGEDRTVETPIPAQFEDRPVRDANGVQKTRLGVRADQLMWLAVAVIGSSSESGLNY